ncbi:MAG: MMPL family transporter, partial [Solimonas sp.]
MMARIRINVGKASVIGRLVSEDQESALVQLELLEHDPGSGTTADLEEMAKPMSERLANAWKRGTAPGELPPEGGPSFAQRIKAVSGLLMAGKVGAGEPSLDYVKVGEKLEEIRKKYETENVTIHIVGFAKVVDDMTKATMEVASFFIVALILMGLLLWVYLGSAPLGAIVVVTSLVSCIWELGLLNLIGYGLDPFALLVPFLIMAVSVSHGVQYVSSWASEISTRNATPYQASLSTFRALAIPGVVALLANVVGFSTIYLINIQIIREMSVNAAFGMVGVIMVNKVLLPTVLSYIKLPNVEQFRIATEKRDRIGDVVFNKMKVLCRRGPATVTVIITALLGVYGAS